MVKMALQNKTKNQKKNTTSLDSFVSRSSGCHIANTERQDVRRNQRYVGWHQGKGRLEICHIQRYTKDEECWSSPQVSFVFRFSLHLSSSLCFPFTSFSGKNYCWVCPEVICHRSVSSPSHFSLLKLEEGKQKLSFVWVIWLLRKKTGQDRMEKFKKLWRNPNHWSLNYTTLSILQGSNLFNFFKSYHIKTKTLICKIRGWKKNECFYK